MYNALSMKITLASGAKARLSLLVTFSALNFRDKFEPRSLKKLSIKRRVGIIALRNRYCKK